MIKTDWTAEEVLRTANITVGIRGEMLRAYAERIAADESAVPVGHFCEMSPGQWEQTRHEFAGLLGVTPLFTHPPAQPAHPAQEQPGWKWVPVEPTDEMITVGNSAADIAGVALNRNFLSAVYQAMTLASPTPPKEK